jgi:hypothetical protein
VSEWKRISDKDDVSLSRDGKTVDVVIDQSAWGNVYIEIPVEFIKAILNAHKN